MARRRRKNIADPKNMRRDMAWSDEQHQKILVECDRQLNKRGCFHKGEVLQALKLEAMAPAIRWDYVAEFLTDPTLSYGHSLLAVAETFFTAKGWRKAEEEVDPVVSGRWIATGHGKKTAGYCLANLHNGLMLLYRTKVMVNRGKGLVGSAKQHVRSSMKDPQIEEGVRQDLAQVVGLRAPKRIVAPDEPEVDMFK
jgi:hypothetical protein